MKIYYLLICLTIFSFAAAQNKEYPRKVYKAKKINPHPPTIDGKLGDIMWEKAVLGDGFLQQDPVEGDSASEKTYFKICYDEKNIYVLIHALDSDPSKIVSLVSRRDDIDNSDIVGVLLDSYCDHRTSFEFSVNAAGVKRDGVHSNDGENEDYNWDPVWESAAGMVDDGWIAELRIPLSQLRFADKDEQLWGLEVYRYIHRKHEVDMWQMIPKNAPGFTSYFGRLEGIYGIESSRRIEILPYAVSQATTYEKETDNPFSRGQEYKLAGGMDGKVGLSGNMTVDFTVNPDFGQVEADPSEVNLSAFETFFAEKRPFFIEGKNIFQYPLGIGDGNFARETLFYSRRIGRPPQYEPDTGDDEYLDSPTQTSIIGAAKLSGKTANGWSIGAMEAMTSRETARLSLYGNRRSITVEPFTNYFITRLQKDFHGGQTNFGGMVTAVNRNASDARSTLLTHSAYTGGIDFLHQWKNKTYFFDLKSAFSQVVGSKEAMLEVQESSTHYFQRPDANYLKLDSNRTSLSGHGGSISIGKQGNGYWAYALGGVWRSPGLELNDVGYLQQADQAMEFIWIGFRKLNPFSIFNRVQMNFNQWRGWNFGGEKIFEGGNINGGGEFRNFWGFWMGINRQTPGLSASALRGGPSLRYEGTWNEWYDIYTDSRKKWQIELSGSDVWADDGLASWHNFSVWLNLKPNRRLTVSLSPFYNLNKDNLQYVDTMEKDGQDRYLMAHLDQKTFGMVFRLNYSMTPELSIQYYGQPFISAGAYTQYKRITQPRADRYEDRFENYSEDQISYDAENEVYHVDEDLDGVSDYSFDLPDFNFKQFRSNLVVRWEYLPGSLLYLVWSQGRTDSNAYGDFSFNRDFRDLFSITPDNIFLIKFSRWFSI